MPIYDKSWAESCDGYLSSQSDPFGRYYSKINGRYNAGRYVSEFAFIAQYAEVTGGPILELACGAGRVMMALARLGYDVYGIDASQPMLMRGQQAVAKLPLPQQERIHFIRGDMRCFRLKQRFPLIIIPFNSFWLNLDWDGAFSCVAAILEHLEPHGFFLIESPDNRCLRENPYGSQTVYFGTEVFPALAKTLGFECAVHVYDKSAPRILIGWKRS